MDDVFDLTVKRGASSCSSKNGRDDLGGRFMCRKPGLLLFEVTSRGLVSEVRLFLNEEALVSTWGGWKTYFARSWDARKESLDDIHDDCGIDLWKVGLRKVKERWKAKTMESENGKVLWQGWLWSHKVGPLLPHRWHGANKAAPYTMRFSTVSIQM